MAKLSDIGTAANDARHAQQAYQTALTAFEAGQIASEEVSRLKQAADDARIAIEAVSDAYDANPEPEA